MATRRRPPAPPGKESIALRPGPTTRKKWSPPGRKITAKAPQAGEATPKPHDPTAASTLNEMGAYVNFSAVDLTLLREAYLYLAPHLVTMADEFYASIQRNPRAQRVIRHGPKQVEQLKATLARWAASLLTEARDSHFGESRRRIGAKHVELRLEHRYVLGAMSIVRTFLESRLRTVAARSPRLTAMIEALHRAIDLDTNLITEAYFAIRHESMETAREKEDQVQHRVLRHLLGAAGGPLNLEVIRVELERVFPVHCIAVILDRPEQYAVQIHGVSCHAALAGLNAGDTILYDDWHVAPTMKSGRPGSIDLTGNETNAVHRRLHSAGIQQLLVFPLWVDGRVVGAFTVGLTKPESSGSLRLDYLAGVADAVAMAVDRSEITSRLSNSEENFRSLFDAVSDGIFMVDTSHRYVLCNPVFLELAGRELEQVIGRTVADVFPEAAALRISSLQVQAISTGKPLRGLVTIQRNDLRRQMAISYSPIRTSSGRVVALTGIARDVTDEQERTAHQIHQHKMTTVGLLAAGIAHEVSNPLASIACMAQDLEETAADPSSKQTLKRIIGATQSAAHSLRQLLQFARPNERMAEAFSVDDIVTNTVEIASFNPRARGLELRTSLTPGLPMVRGNADDLSQVVLNLLLNAIDAMEGRSGVVVVRTRRDGSWVAIDVEDAGTGIGPELISRIFEPFFSTKTVGRGTGLGLFVSRQIVTDHGGRLIVSSRLDHGTTFTIQLLPVP